ncbi:MAG: hypothetical protein JNK79_16175 [Chitinophagaceae bacterium]|nr:hypothetical protein [Chitinophagaceae bacterium]
MRWLTLCSILICATLASIAQDSSVNFERKVVTLKEVVVRSNLNVPAFIRRVKDDTTFHKAFLNLRVLGYTSLNDIRMLDKKNTPKATLISRTRQETGNGCRWMKTLEEKSTGDIFDKNHSYNYYTAQLYSSIFLAHDTVCGESNIVAGTKFTTQGKSGIAKHKEQLKMLFFNPGKRIPGLPFIGNKIALFDEDVAALYDFTIDMTEYKGEMCYVFHIAPMATLDAVQKDRIVINEMTTWFDTNTWEIRGRNYDLSYKAGVYDFDVHIEVEMTKFGEYLVPKVMRYNGNWDVIFKKRENGIFTATLFDFNK